MSLTHDKVEAFIFDMDGTMIDSMPWHARSWVEFVAVSYTHLTLPTTPYV